MSRTMHHFGSVTGLGNASERLQSEKAEALPDAPKSSTGKRPVRMPPTEDLLSAKDVAKAFQLTYEPVVEGTTRPADKDQQKNGHQAVADWILDCGLWIGKQAVARFQPTIQNPKPKVVSIGAKDNRLARDRGFLRSRLLDRGFWTGIATALVVAVIGLGVWSMGRTHPPLQEARQMREPAPVLSTSIPIAPVVLVPVMEKAPREAQLAASVAEANHPIPTAAPPPPQATIKPAVKAAPVDDPRALWLAALDAESHRDFATAVQQYEHIESLPNNQWPAGLKTRLDLARQELNGGI